MKVISDPAYGTTALVFKTRDDLETILQGLHGLLEDLTEGKSGLPAVFVQSPLGMVDEQMRDEIHNDALRALLGPDVAHQATVMFAAEPTEKVPSTLDTFKEAVRRVINRLAR